MHFEDIFSLGDYFGQVQEYMRQHKLTLPEKKNNRWLRKQFTELYNGVDSSSLDDDHVKFEEQVPRRPRAPVGPEVSRALVLGRLG